MTWPATPGFGTGDMDAGTDSPASARDDLKAMADDLTNVINGRNQASGVCPLDSNGRAPLANIPGLLLRRVAHTTPGAGSWNVPANVRRVGVWVLGGSGGGGYTTGAVNPHGGGGGAGSVAYKVYEVEPGSTFNFVVGAGGAGGASGGADADGAPGVATTCTSPGTATPATHTVTGGRGRGGLGYTNGSFGGGYDGSSNGDINFPGGIGGPGVAGRGGIGGGHMFGGGQQVNSVPLGGGGTGSGDTGGSGIAGGIGAVIFEY